MIWMLRNATSIDCTSDVPGMAEMKAVLARERSRSDRIGDPFGLVLLSFGADAVPAVRLPEVTAFLSDRLRLTDAFGWYDERTLGIVLPHTDSDGAWIFADDLLQACDLDHLRTACKVFVYPSNWPVNVGADEIVRRAAPGRTGPVRVRGSNGEVDPDADTESLQPFDQEVSEDSRKLFMLRVPGWKRALDMLGGLLLLVAASPLMLLVALYIRLVSRGPVLFRQQRIGFGGRPFTFLKFRTMRVDSDAEFHRERYARDALQDEPIAKLDDEDPRIIPLGRFLRSSCLDELPQLLNVLRGEMSLVGPRPCLPYEAAMFLRWHHHRFDILPGITGLWQVGGKNELTLREKIRLDIRYAREMSPWLDLEVLLRTPLVIVRQVLGLRQRAEPRLNDLEVP